MKTEVLPMKYSESFADATEIADAVNETLDRLHDPDCDFRDRLGTNEGNFRELVRPHGGHTVYVWDDTLHVPTRKDESLRTFKRRGSLAATAIALEADPTIQEFVTASAGNHAIGVAAAAQEYGRTSRIFSASSLSDAKRNKLIGFTARLHDEYADIAGALGAAQDYADLHQDTAFIHPFDQIEVIAGQATLGMDVLGQLLHLHDAGSLDVYNDPIKILLPEGGGGLAAGVAIVFEKARRNGLFGDNVSIISVAITQKQSNAWCDGTATTTGTLTTPILEDPRFVQDRIVVPDLEVAEAMHTLTGSHHKRIEPAGALGYAGVRQLATRFPTRDGYERTMFVTPITGANVSQETYDHATKLRDEDYHGRLRELGTWVTQDALADTENNENPATSVHRGTKVAGGFRS